MYTINPDDTVPFDAFCDMSNGGWTVFQRRQDGTTNFYRGWADYVAGFGNLTGNLWAGLDKLHSMTSMYNTELLVVMATFEDESAWAQYRTFSVGNASTGYLLSVSKYSGTAGNCLTTSKQGSNGQKFTTYDNDQDGSVPSNCAVQYQGAWWYNCCHCTNPNGLYLNGTTTSYAKSVFVVWATFKGYSYSLKSIEFKLRRL